LRALAEFLLHERTDSDGTASSETLFKRWESRAGRISDHGSKIHRGHHDDES